MNWIPMDKRFKLRKTGQAKHVCLFTRAEYLKAETIMTEAYGLGQSYYPGTYRTHDSVPNYRNWFYSWKPSNRTDVPLGASDFRIYFRTDEQKTFLTLAMA
jgi:hypothetical protein